jgi:hypothetical protein
MLSTHIGASSRRSCAEVRVQVLSKMFHKSAHCILQVVSVSSIDDSMFAEGTAGILTELW